jgi:hypothetical protein
MIETVLSVNNIPIRLTDEPWAHITEEHCELAGLRLEVLEVIANPQRLLAGGAGEILAVQEYSTEKYLIVVYRELEKDDFVITSFLTTKTNPLNRRKQLWP